MGGWLILFVPCRRYAQAELETLLGKSFAGVLSRMISVFTTAMESAQQKCVRI